MSWDNVSFNVNGETDEDLLRALQLVVGMHAPSGAKAFLKTRSKGLILLWHGGADKEAQAFPSPLTADQLFPVVKAYLESKEAREVECDGWDSNSDHDGHNGPGWRVYVEDWGHVQTHYAICAVKPVFLWYGK